MRAAVASAERSARSSATAGTSRPEQPRSQQRRSLHRQPKAAQPLDEGFGGEGVVARLLDEHPKVGERRLRVGQGVSRVTKIESWAVLATLSTS